MSLRSWKSFMPSVYHIRFKGGPHNGQERTWIAEHKVTVGTRHNKYRPAQTILHENNEYELSHKSSGVYVYVFVRNHPIQFTGDPYGNWGNGPSGCC